MMDLSRRPPCYPKTRLDYFKVIVDWVFNAAEDKSNVFWLHGLAGSGKSAIATTVANYFLDHKRLGAFISFDRRGTEEDNDPYRVFRTLAYQLSRFDKRIHDHIVKASEGNAHAMQLSSQFRDLIKHPLELSAISYSEGPIVIIIDALDECGSDDPGSNYDRGPLLSLLANATSQLPPAVRIVITSRAVPDINDNLQGMDNIHIEELKVSPENKDISIFIRQRLSEIAKKRRLAANWLDGGKVATLVERAEGLFIWAATACKLIDSYKPGNQLNSLVNGTAKITLDELYRRALDSCERDWSNPDFEHDYCNILGLILAAKDPLSPCVIDSFSEVQGSYELISRLGSVLYHQGEDDPVRILHVSFREFLSDQSKCVDPRWFIDVPDHNGRLAKRCLEVLGAVLRDRHSQLGLDEPRTSESLDKATMYACSYWISHVCEMKTCPEGFGQYLYDFLAEYLIRWFETMSMMEKSRGTTGLLEQLHKWVVVGSGISRCTMAKADEWQRTTPDKTDLSELAYDASRFAAFFCDTIAEHPALVSLSALPFAPLDTKIHQLFHRGSTNLPTVLGGYQQSWSPSLRVFRHGGLNVDSMAFSPDGSRVVASVNSRVGFFETGVTHGLRIWDVMTGCEDVPVGEVDGRCIVTFSPDGSKVWAASKKGTIWTMDTATGEISARPPWKTYHSNVERSRKDKLHMWESLDEMSLVGAKRTVNTHMSIHSMDLDTATLSKAEKADNPALGHEHHRYVRAAFSPDGLTVVWGSEDGTLRVIDVQKGEEVCPALTDVPMEFRGLKRMYRSIVFSPDGSRFASASGDGTIHIRYTATGQEVMPKLVGHSGEVTALKFNDEGLISSAEADSTIRTWDITTGKEVRIAHVQSTSECQPLGFSPDGSKLASTSEDGTIHMWDVISGKELGPVLQGHFNQSSSVAFSCDGSRLVSGAFRDTIQVWDVASVRRYNPKIERHERPPHSMSFSPDGLLIESRRPNNVKFWDTITGKGLSINPYDKFAHFSPEGSNVVMPPSALQSTPAVPATLFDSESGANWVPQQESSYASRLARTMEPDCDIPPCSYEGAVEILGKVVWRLPLELKHRCCAVRNNFLAFGFWDCRVCVVHLPDQLVEPASGLVFARVESAVSAWMPSGG